MKLFGYQTPLIMLVLWLFLVISFFYALIAQDWTTAFVSGITIGISAYMIYLNKTVDFHIPKTLLTFALFFIYATLFLGEVENFYERFWWWDAVLHTGSAIGFGIVGVTILAILFRKQKVHASPFIIAVFAFSLAVAIGAVWEIFEFAMDQIFGLNMQKSGLVDTMWDLIVDSIGALLAALGGYFYLSKSDISGPISNLIEEAVEENL